MNTKDNKQKKYKPFSNFSEVTKLALKNTIIGIIASFVLFLFLPAILNYPENTLNNEFQVEMVGIKYIHQCFVIGFVLSILFFITFRFAYKGLSLRDIEKKSNKEISELRKKCFSYPYRTLIIQIAIPTLLTALLLVGFKTDFELLLRLTVVIFCYFSLFSVSTYIVNRKFFENILTNTSNLVKNPIPKLGFKIKDKIVLLAFPLFLYSSVLILLISTTVMTTAKGNLQYSLYRNELENMYSDIVLPTPKEALKKLETISLTSDSDELVMFSAETGKVYYTNETINDFLIQYAINFYDNTEGQTYEYYGKNIQTALLKVRTTEGDYFVGVRFKVFSDTIFTPFYIAAIACLVFNLVFLYKIGSGFSNDIHALEDRLKAVSHQENISNASKLPITSNDEIGNLTNYYNKVQDLMILNITQLRDNQNQLMEQERLASLGQLIGGISHNLKTPIMSIAGASEGLTDLINEYDKSIGDPDVTAADHHAIANDMREWIDKIHSYTTYMSDVITAVKGQAVTLSEQDQDTFTIDELLKRVNILMKHELTNSHVALNVKLNKLEDIKIHGSISSLVQIINNLISNSIQSYKSASTKNAIELETKKLGNNLILTIEDHGCGIPVDVQKKLFKEMITTKGKNGTGLGLFMSYSTIKGKFNGDMTFDSEVGKGTKFTITLPISK